MTLILYGNEPYCIDAHKKKALKGIDNMNLDYLRGTFDAEVLAKCRTFPFFAEKRGVVLDVETLKDLDTKFFKEYLQNPVATTELVVLCRKVDGRLKIYKDLSSKELLLACNKVESESQVQKVITYELGKLDAKIASDAMTEFIRRINYFGKEDMTLLTAVSYIKSVAAVTKEIRVDDIIRFVPKFEEPDIFSLVSLIKEKRTDELLHQISMIPKDDAIGVLSLILRSFRIAYNSKLFPQSEVTKGKGSDLFKDTEVGVLNSCIGTLTDVIYSIKKGVMAQDLALKTACVKVIGLL